MENPRFDVIIRNIKKITKAKNQKEVAAIIGITASAITDAKKRNVIPERWLQIIEEKYDVEREKIFALTQGSQSVQISLPSADKQSIFSQEGQMDVFDQVMDQFFEMVKNWQVEENGRNVTTAIKFTQEFALRFPEMMAWQKKSGEGGGEDRLHHPARNTD